jgi:hypothetical protein
MMAGRIRNPRYVAPVRQPLTAIQREALRTALQTYLATVAPVNQELVSVHEIAAYLRASVPGVPGERYDGADIAAALRALGHTVS